MFPPQARRLAPDFFFQKHIYRPNGGTVLLPPGVFTMEASRGPEYRTVKTQVTIPAAKETTLPVKLERWFNAADFGYYSGDHHIHAAGCAHYTSPTEGMPPEHMFQQVKGEGLNVGSVLSWGYGFEHQRQFFGPQVDALSEPLTQMKYDMEVSGFGSAALGHVCLLNLRELVYPGADGIKGWPTWNTPALRWTKQQGGFTGYPHSGSGMQVNSATAAKRMLNLLDANKDTRLTADETRHTVLPEPFDKIDADHDGGVNEAELVNSHERVLDSLPNFAVPDAGGHEIFVTTAIGVCDFISAMDSEPSGLRKTKLPYNSLAHMAAAEHFTQAKQRNHGQAGFRGVIERPLAVISAQPARMRSSGLNAPEDPFGAGLGGLQIVFFRGDGVQLCCGQERAVVVDDVLLAIVEVRLVVCLKVGEGALGCVDEGGPLKYPASAGEGCNRCPSTLAVARLTARLHRALLGAVAADKAPVEPLGPLVKDGHVKVARWIEHSL